MQHQQSDNNVAFEVACHCHVASDERLRALDVKVAVLNSRMNCKDLIVTTQLFKISQRFIQRGATRDRPQPGRQE